MLSGPICKEVKGMRCEDVRNLADKYLTGALPEELAADIEHHLADCPSCTEFISELRPLFELMSDIEEEPLPEGFENRLHMRLLEASGKSRRLAAAPGRWIKWGTGIAAALALVISLQMIPWNDLRSKNNGSIQEYSLNSTDAGDSADESTLDENMERVPGLKANQAPNALKEDYFDPGNESMMMDRISAIYLYVSGNNQAEDRVIEIAEGLGMEVVERSSNTIVLQINEGSNIDELTGKLAVIGRVETESNGEEDNNITIHVMNE